MMSMNRPRFVLVVLLCLAFSPSEAQESQVAVPDPPAGYSWVFVPGTSTAVLRPDGWFVTIEEEDGTIACFISQENWQEKGKFGTGFSFNFIKGVSVRTGSSARRYAESLIRGLASTYEVLIEPTGSELATDLILIGMRYRVDAEEWPVTVYSQVIADNFGDSIRVMVFESPENAWDEMWAIGQVMMKAQVGR
jgi:hypothetical protein